MENQNGTYLSAEYISYAGTLKRFSQSENPLQPIFEAFTNSLDAIQILKERHSVDNRGKIVLRIFVTKNLMSQDKSFNFQKIEVFDNGVGFDNDEFGRLKALNDDGKGFNNRGSGRVQFLHFFNTTKITSIYRSSDSTTGYKERDFTLSKSKPFLDKNAIIRLDKEFDTSIEESSTTVSFSTLINKKSSIINFFDKLTITFLKEQLISHYLAYFCENRDLFPNIILEYYINNNLKKTDIIKAKDIPKFEKQKPIDIYYSKLSQDGKTIEKTSDKESFNLKAFRIPKEQLSKNSLKLVSKGQIANSIPLASLTENDHIDNQRFLFLLSSDYITKSDTDNRGELDIPTIENLKNSFSNAFAIKEVILFEDIKEKTNRVIEGLYKEIKNKSDEKQKNIEELKQMFLLNDEHLDTSRINLNDSDDQILRKVYEADAKVIAKRDAEIKIQIEILNKLSPKEKDYQNKLQIQVDELVRMIPIQNRTALIHYVARRKLVLEMFDKILNREIEAQNNGTRNVDEKLLHNLIFQQSSKNPEDSDLWLINEDFIYFKGTSESSLGWVTLNGESILKKELSEEEEAYRLKQEGDANQQ